MTRRAAIACQAALVGLAVATAGGAHAATQVLSFPGEPAVPDIYNGQTYGHVIWFKNPNPFGSDGNPNNETNFIFDQGGGTFTIAVDTNNPFDTTMNVFQPTIGTVAVLEGGVYEGFQNSILPKPTPPTSAAGSVVVTSATNSWQVHAEFRFVGVGAAQTDEDNWNGGGSDGVCSGHLELTAAAYTGGGGPVDPCTWWMFEMVDFDPTTGTGSYMTGTGDNAGVVVGLSEVGPNAQVGLGANGKNINLGLSNWMKGTIYDDPDVTGGDGLTKYAGKICNTTTGTNCTPYRGDFNVDWESPTVTPLPPAVLLLATAVTGLFGAGAWRRRRVAA